MKLIKLDFFKMNKDILVDSSIIDIDRTSLFVTEELKHSVLMKN